MIRALNKSLLQDPIVLAAPFETLLERRPVTIDILSPAEFHLSKVQKVSFGLLLIPAVLGFLYSVMVFDWTMVGICGFVLLLNGVLLAVVRLRARMRWQVTWHEDFVDVVDGRYGPVIRWREPIQNFSGIRRDFGVLSGTGRYTSNRRVYGLMFEHPDPQKSILLHASHAAIGREIEHDYARQLGLPVLEDRP